MCIYNTYRYDPECIPTYPVQQEERKRLCCTMLSEYYTTKAQPSGSHVVCESGEGGEGGRGVDYSASEVADVHITRRDSHHLVASLPHSNSSIGDDTDLCKV